MVGGLIQRAGSGPTGGVGGPKFGPELGPERRRVHGPKTGPEWGRNLQMSLSGRGEMGQQFGAHDEAGLVYQYGNVKNRRERNKKSGSVFSTK